MACTIDTYDINGTAARNWRAMECELPLSAYSDTGYCGSTDSIEYSYYTVTTCVSPLRNMRLQFSFHPGL